MRPTPFAEIVNRLRNGGFTPAEVQTLHALTTIMLTKRGYISVIESKGRMRP